MGIELNQQPFEIEDVAVSIVHAGLAREIDWLRANGHAIPTWQERRAARYWRRTLTAFRLEAYYAMQVLPPQSFVRTSWIAGNL